MTGRDAVDILGMIERRGIKFWLDGGWAEDALLGRQTRHHEDLDIVIEQKDLDAVVEMFSIRGYHRVYKNSPLPWKFVLSDGARREVDFHVVVLDELGNGVYGPPANAKLYLAKDLKSIGSIRGKVFRCVSHRS